MTSPSMLYRERIVSAICSINTPLTVTAALFNTMRNTHGDKDSESVLESGFKKACGSCIEENHHEQEQKQIFWLEKNAGGGGGWYNEMGGTIEQR